MPGKREMNIFHLNIRVQVLSITFIYKLVGLHHHLEPKYSVTVGFVDTYIPVWVQSTTFNQYSGMVIFLALKPF